MAAANTHGTVLPLLELPEEAPEPPRVATGMGREDVLTVAGAAGSAIALAVLFDPVLGAVGTGWTPFFAFLWFVALYAVLVFLRNPGPAVRDRFWTVVLWAAGVVVLGSLLLVVGFTVIKGGPVFGQIFDAHSGQSLWQRLHFFTHDMSGVGPLSGLDVGGILYALVGTVVQIGIALVITIPLGLTTALFLGEVGGAFARFTRTIVEAMTALPSVVAGLFIYALIILTVTHEPNGLAAALSLVVLMLPITIRAADVVLRLVPGNLRESGLALGAGQWSTVWHVVLPTVRPGLVTAIIVATAHGIGETAPVLLTSGVTSVTNWDPFRGNMTSLPLAALEFIESPEKTMIARGFATAAFLLIFVIVLFAVARALGGSQAGKQSPGQARRAAASSRRTAVRIGRSTETVVAAVAALRARPQEAATTLLRPDSAARSSAFDPAPEET